jgi:hypothetical protein
MWMIVKCKDSDISDFAVAFGFVLGIGAIIVDGITLEILINQVFK